MKKSVQIPKYAVVLLIVGFMLSLIVNVIQFEKNSSDFIMLSGTYSNNNHTPECVYMAFDNKGHFCTYTQKDGITEEGNYIESKENLYELNRILRICSSHRRWYLFFGRKRHGGFSTLDRRYTNFYR